MYLPSNAFPKSTNFLQHRSSRREKALTFLKFEPRDLVPYEILKKPPYGTLAPCIPSRLPHAETLLQAAETVGSLLHPENRL